jgi:hypothetical protein
MRNCPAGPTRKWRSARVRLPGGALLSACARVEGGLRGQEAGAGRNDGLAAHEAFILFLFIFFCFLSSFQNLV